MNKLSAINFRDPLLRVLGKMTEFTPDQPVKGEDTYNEVLALMGITDPEEYGTNGPSKQPQTYKWIQWANTGLRKAGMTSNAKRGYWQLTSGGVQAAIKAANAAGDTQTTAPVVATTDPALVLASTTVAAAPAPAPVAAPVTIPVHRSTLSYHEDAYIVSLAIAETGCFGAFSSHKSAACSDCPLATECRNRMSADLTRFAATLAAEDIAAAAPPAPAPVAAPAAPAASDPTPTKMDVSGIDFSTADIIKAVVESECVACGGSIPEKQRCRWLDTINGGDGGLFHLDCSGGE